MNTEPVRTSVFIAAFVSAVSTALLGISILDEVTFQAVCGAVGAAVGQFALIAFGAEVARQKAWSPASVDELVTAENAIAQFQAET